MLSFQTQQMQIFAVRHPDNPIPDKNADQSTSRKQVNENHLDCYSPPWLSSVRLPYVQFHRAKQEVSAAYSPI